ncbi:MAG: CRISPR-associated protein Cas5 [Methanobacteriota archaeon]|nr:MAG: CRISPR-associated protein Cas5 [Euryarchaeota archaeon]
MRAFRLRIRGHWAHFRRIETNNQPLTHNIIPKTAFVGLMGAVSGWERKELRVFFPQLCRDIAYSISVPKPLSKMSLGFTARPYFDKPEEKTRKTMEVIRAPEYEVIVALRQNGTTAEQLFCEFLTCIKNEEQYFPAVLGLHNCPCELSFLDEGIAYQTAEGEFLTSYFVLSSHTPQIDTSGNAETVLGFDEVPTVQNRHLRNLPDSYISVVFPVGGAIKVKGVYNLYKSSRNIKLACVLI